MRIANRDRRELDALFADVERFDLPHLERSDVELDDVAVDCRRDGSLVAVQLHASSASSRGSSTTSRSPSAWIAVDETVPASARRASATTPASNISSARRAMR